MSEDKSRAAHHVEDLSVLSRRGALSAAEQRTLAEALESNATLSTAHQLGLDFDRVATVKPGDDALIAQMATRVVNRSGPAGSARFRLRALLLAATLALAGSATAFWQRARFRPPARTPAAGSVGGAAIRVVAPGPAPFATTDRAPTTPRQRSAEPPKAAASGGAPLASAGRAASAASAEAGSRAFDSAESLFHEANAARRSGDQAAARALYLRLQHDFPASDEAHLAHVSLGNLLLAMGRAGEAERQFASYLGGRSALAQEALVGRAQSLAALGRNDEEERVWQALLHDYPGSVYARRAKQRLAELGSAARP
jgi:TolA-binding protein